MGPSGNRDQSAIWSLSRPPSCPIEGRNSSKESSLTQVGISAFARIVVRRGVSDQG